MDKRERCQHGQALNWVFISLVMLQGTLEKAGAFQVGAKGLPNKVYVTTC